MEHGNITGPQGTNGADGIGGITQEGPEIAVSGTGAVADPYIVSTRVYTIGLWPELGGYVFRISADGRHGLVIETQDQSTSVDWYLAHNSVTDPTNHSLNGQKIMDWRLPTKYELNEIYSQNGAIGVFNSNLYWSSTESYPDNAWTKSLNFGGQGYYDKVNNGGVRSVRAF